MLGLITTGISLYGTAKESGIFDTKKAQAPSCPVDLKQIENLALDLMKRYNSKEGAFIYGRIRESGIPDTCSDRIKQAIANKIPEFKKWREARKAEKEQAQAQAEISGQITGSQQLAQPITATAVSLPGGIPGITKPTLMDQIKKYIIPGVIGLGALYFIFKLKK